ncbi:MAG TPA: hypothetical protein VFU85_12480 [Nocardioides sp.]|nr:hypothetical protein [Nocardioides sp.]
MRALNCRVAGPRDPQALASAHDQDAAASAKATALRARIGEVDRKVAGLVGALESGVSVSEGGSIPNDDPRRGPVWRPGCVSPSTHAGSRPKMQKALEDLGGIAEILPSAHPALRAKLHAALGVQLDYDHVLKRVMVTAESACVPGRVRRGT